MKSYEHVRKSCSDNYSNLADANNNIMNKALNCVLPLRTESSNSGGMAKKKPRPNTANYFKIKHPSFVNKNGLVKEDVKDPVLMNTAKHLNLKNAGLRMSKEIKSSSGCLAGDQLSKRKFTIRDLD